MMQSPLQITFRHMDSSPALEETIRRKVEKLDAIYNKITGCHVVVEVPHNHHRHGKHFQVKVNLAVPGREIVVNRETSKDDSHEDVHGALNDAIDTVRRKLQDYLREVQAV